MGMLANEEILFWALIVVVIILFLYYRKSDEETGESYFSGRYPEQVDAKYLARQQQGASIGNSKNMGELDLQYNLY